MDVEKIKDLVRISIVLSDRYMLAEKASRNAFKNLAIEFKEQSKKCKHIIIRPKWTPNDCDDASNSLGVCAVKHCSKLK